MLFLLVLACGPSSSDVAVTVEPTPDTDPVPSTDTDTDTDQGADTDPPPPAKLVVHSERVACEPGEYVDANFQIPIGTVVQSALLVKDGGDGHLWLSASEGVVIWDGTGAADLFCSWTPGPSGEEVFWEGYGSTVSAARVTWVAPE